MAVLDDTSVLGRLANRADVAHGAAQSAIARLHRRGEVLHVTAQNLIEFRNFANDTDALPFDHHELAGLVAPRGLIVIDNSDYLWLGPWSAWGCMTAGRLIYDALGARDNMGYSSVGNHSHCLFPTDRELPDLTAFYNRFLLDEKGNTDIFYNSVNLTFDARQWIDWKVTRLY